MSETGRTDADLRRIARTLEAPLDSPRRARRAPHRRLTLQMVAAISLLLVGGLVATSAARDDRFLVPLLVLVVVLGAFAGLLAYLVVRPLLELATAARAARAGGVFELPHEPPPNEIGDLGRELERAFTALAASRSAVDRLAEALDHSRVATAVASRSNRVLWGNAAFARLVGHGQHELKGVDYRDLLQPVFADVDLRRSIAAAADPSDVRLTLARDGGARIHELGVESFAGENEGPAGLVVAIEDVTARARAERRAEEEARLQRAILGAIPAEIFITDRDGRIRGANEAAARSAGRTPREIEGLRSDEVLGPDHAAIGARDPQVIASGEPILGHIVERWHPGAGWARVDKIPLRDEHGAVAGVLSVITDVTELKSVANDLEERNRELDEFAYVASHDLKAPLRAIDSLSQFLVEDLGDDLPDASRRHLQQMRRRVARMDRLLSDLLAYSRAGRQKMPLEEIELGALLRSRIDMLPVPDGFVIDLPRGELQMQVERVPLEQVFLNLIGNAIKHHPRPTGRVSIEAHPAGNMWRFVVADDGAGIAPQYHERIFQMFRTLRPRDEVEGSGIGLAVTRKLVESRGGVIRVESGEGVGARFLFTWPRAEDEG